MSHPSLSRRARLRARTRTTAVVLTTAALSVAGLGAMPTASSAPSPGCPAAYPVAEVVKGQEVNGLTVTSGTEPTGFTGEIVGVIRNGIAPDLDMIMARLAAPEIGRVGGIWQGMSGSPVYAADGRLIGAVAYGLAGGASPVAGITPAAEMYRMLSAGTAPAPGSLKQSVALPSSLARQLVSDGVVGRAEASSGLTRLPVPLGVSGMAGSKRLRMAEKALSVSGARVRASGAVTAASEAIPLTVGGNVAASLSYGDVSTVGVGTVTAICGNEVLAFGHPMNFSGPATLSMHGADAVYVQEDSLGQPFKVANAGAPIGVVNQDRLAGLFGINLPSAVPATTLVKSSVTVLGEGSRTGTTRISEPLAVPDIAAMHLLAGQDRVFDGLGGGSAALEWTIRGQRADGRWFSVVRGDRYTSRVDLSSESGYDLYDQLGSLVYNEIEDVTIKDVTTKSTMTRRQAAYSIGAVQYRPAKRWRPLRAGQPLFLLGGTKIRIRVRLVSPTMPHTWAYVHVPVPRTIGYKSGILEIAGGNSSGGGPMGGDDLFEELFGGGDDMGSEPATLDALLRQLRRAPRNDQVLANLSLFRRDMTVLGRSARATTRAVVNGGFMVEVQGIGRR